MANKRVDRLDSIIQKELSNIIMFDLDSKEIGFCTVTEVRLTGDLSIARVYVSFMGKNYNVQALNKHKAYIRKELAHRLTIRKVPELEFIVDDTLDRVERISEIAKRSAKD